MEWFFEPLIEAVKKLPFDKLTGPEVFALLILMLVLWAIVALVYTGIYLATKILTGGQLVGIGAMFLASLAFGFVIFEFKEILTALDVVLIFFFYLSFIVAVVYYTSRTRKAYIH